jgi:hypothetical protein
MSAYQTIFYSMPYISYILAGVALLSLILQKQAILARSIAFSLQFWIAPLFYFTYMAIVQRTAAVVVIAVCLELLFLAIYQVLFRRLFAAVVIVSEQRLSKMLVYLKGGTWIVIAMAVFIFCQGGAGIFSKGSKSDIVVGSRLNLYIIYASSLVQVAMIPVIAAIINTEKRWRGSVLFYLIVISILSVLSGSKGGILLTLLAITSLLKFECVRDFIRVLWAPLGCVVVLFSVTVYVVGQFLSLEPSAMISLMFSRIFLTDDCRALAIDWSGLLGYHSTSIFRESFRLYANLIGNPPAFPPLGNYLYALQFGLEGIDGANTSSTALLIAYGSDIGKILFVVLLAGVALGTGILADIPGRGHVLRLAVGINLLSLLSQDFLAFQLTTNILVILLVAVLIKTMFTKILRLASTRESMARRPPMMLPE